MVTVPATVTVYVIDTLVDNKRRPSYSCNLLADVLTVLVIFTALVEIFKDEAILVLKVLTNKGDFAVVTFNPVNFCNKDEYLFV